MTKNEPPSFTERKKSPLVWIVPSVLLHVVVLVLWLSMPEEPPRQPGERKLNIDAEQAEELQDLVEDSNLRELQASVAEMQAIKERMARIRANKMVGLVSFEQSMLQEAPKDIADLISEVLEVQASTRELSVGTLATLERIREASKPVESLLEKDPVAGIRALKNLVPVRNEIAGVRDTLEEKVSTSKAIAGSIRAKTEWISDVHMVNRIDELLEGVAALNEGMNTLNRELGSSVGGRPRRFLNELAEEEASSIETLQAYDEMVNSQEAKQALQETQQQLREQKQNLAEVTEELETHLARVKNLEGSERKDLTQEISRQERKKKNLERNISRGHRRLERKGYLPDNGLKREHDRLQWKLKEAFRGPANPEVFTEFLERQETFVHTANELRTSLEAM